MTIADIPYAQEAAPEVKPEASSGERKPYQLGILFVHGMGQQERGDTITQMGDSLGEWLRRQLANREDTDFRIREAALRGSTSSGDTASASVSGLAHASVLLTGTDKGKARSEEWLLAESWWADAFRPATFSELAFWAIAVGPWLIASQQAGLRQRSRLAYENEPPELWRVLIDRLVVLILLAVAALVAAVITPLAIGLLVLSLIPIPVVSSAIRGVVQGLSGSFGDLLVLVRSPVRFAAMAERVRADIEALSMRADHVMVVAHSQGSAVAWHAIRRNAQAPKEQRARVDLFLTFGQAFRKLKALHRIHTEVPGREQLVFAALAAASTLVLLFMGLQLATVIGTVIGLEGSMDDAGEQLGTDLLVAGASLVVLIATQLVLGGKAQKNDDASEALIVEDLAEVTQAFPQFRWVDLWASADPAPNGPLFKREVTGVQTLRIRNLASTLLDHSVYWSNVTEFVSAVAYAAASVVEWSPLGRTAVPDRLRRASIIRDGRVSMLALGRIAVFAGLLGALWTLRDLLPEVGARMLEFVATLPFVPGAWVTGWHSGWQGTLAAAAITAVAAVSWWLIGALWDAVIRRDEGAFFGGGEMPAQTPLSVLWAVAAFLVPTAVMLGLWVFAGRGSGLLFYVPITFVGVLVVIVLLRGRERRLSDL